MEAPNQPIPPLKILFYRELDLPLEQMQNQHLKQTYDFELPDAATINAPELNEQAKEAAAFMSDMSLALVEGINHGDSKVRHLIRAYLDFLNEHGHSISTQDFVAQTMFFLSDDFHLRMLEDQQTGLAYYLRAAAESFAAEG